jgi:ATP-dependent DNA helicase RecG
VIDVSSTIEEWVPDVFLDIVDLVTLSEAIRGIHFPDTPEHLQAALRRMKFNELFLHQLRAERVRQSVVGSIAPIVPFNESHAKHFVSQLPFELTKDQKVATWQVLQDIATDTPMNRLLEGDVGSGKTVVAGMVADMVVRSGAQVALMAPTSILAEQHFGSFCELFPSDTVIALKTGDTVRFHNYTSIQTSKAGQKQEFLSLLRKGTIDIAIGTHALITKDVFFQNLALAIVDEQHRFGVNQRRLLKEQSGNTDTTPHFLSMTATPIPRSYALALYGELDVSIIKTMPKGRKPVNTQCIQESERSAAYDFIQGQVKEGRQAFVICPMIDGEGNEMGEKKTVLAEYEKLSQLIFPNLRVTYVHGKMKAPEKEDTMQAFAAGEFDILVATSVIEVGVNIPNASVMIIENAERFGLAQLHQFRGRVGRSSHQSYCFLFTDSRSNNVLDRLEFFSEHTDGFDVAEYDLQLRGPGEVYGKAQSGAMQFRFASLTDTDLIALAQQCVRGIDITSYPTLAKEMEIWEAQLHLE